MSEDKVRQLLKTLQINVLSNDEYAKLKQSPGGVDKTALYLTPYPNYFELFKQGYGDESITSIVRYIGNSPDGRPTQPLAYGRQSMAIGPYCQTGYGSVGVPMPDVEALLSTYESVRIDASKDYVSGAGEMGAAFGYDNLVLGGAAFSANRANKAVGDQSAAFGNGCVSGGMNSFAAGHQTIVGGISSAGFGQLNTISGSHSFGAGYSNIVRGAYSVAFGKENKVYINESLAIGYKCQAGTPEANPVSTHGSLAFGLNSQASASASIAMGVSAHAKHAYAAAIGWGVTTSAASQVVLGKHNADDKTQAFILGQGTTSAKLNIFTVSTTGDVKAAGDITTPGNLYHKGGKVRTIHVGTEAPDNDFGEDGDIFIIY